MSTNQIDRNTNPWNGLRTYTEGELIYGRSEEIHVLSLLILQSHQTVVYGKSGIGKSSILNAGIFPIIRKHGSFPVYIRFEHNVGISYLQQIKDAILREIEKSAGNIRVNTLVEKSDNETLWEFFHRIEYKDAEGNELKPLIVFDQFEEIFTLENDKSKINTFFRELADLINNVMPEHLSEAVSKNAARPDGGQSAADNSLDLGLDLFNDVSFSYKANSDYHIVFTLREDFLSYLERSTTDIPALKNNRYCLQPINDEQAAEIITQPRPGLVDKNVAKLIIEKVTGEKDFEIDGIPEIQVDSAILSLYLSRIYDKMQAEGDTKITAVLVEAHSANIIEDFYNDAIRSLPDSSIEWLENTLINDDGRRDNRDKSTVIRESGLSETELDRLINDVKLLRQFSYGGDLRIEYIHDVLCPVILERRRKRTETEKIQAIEKKAREEKRKSRKRIIMIVGFFVLIAAVTGAWLFRNYYLNEKLFERYYAGFELINGWPRGTGAELTAAQQQTSPLYYKLSKKGTSTPEFTEVEICSSNTFLPPSSRTDWAEICTDNNDIRGAIFNRVFSTLKYIRFLSGENGLISRMELYGENGELQLIYSYFHTTDNSAWINFLLPSGQGCTIRDNGIDRCKIGWDSIGQISNLRYFTSAGNLQPVDNKNLITGYMFKYSEDGGSMKYFLNESGQPSRDMTYNMVRVYANGDTTLTRYAKVKSVDDTEGEEAIGDAGYSKILNVGDTEYLFLPDATDPVAECKVLRDANGNITEQIISGVHSSKTTPVMTWKYMGNTGLITERKMLTADRRPYGSPSEIYLWLKDYSESGELISEKRVAVNGDTLYSFNLASNDLPDMKINTRTVIDKSAGITDIQIDSLSPDGTFSSTSYYGKNMHPVNRRNAFSSEDSVECHLIRKFTGDNYELNEFYMADQNGAIVPVPTVIDPNTFRATSFRHKTMKDGDNRIIELSAADSSIVKRMMYIEQNGQTIGRAACSIIDNKPVRCPEWEEEGCGYYVIYFTKDFSDWYSSLQPYDEWWNLSTFMYGKNDYRRVKYLNLKNMKLEGGFPISGNFAQPIMENDPEAIEYTIPYIHILSEKSLLYKDPSGRLSDGDRIIALGNWQISMPAESLEKEWRKLYDAANTVDITVLRPEGETMVRHNVSVKGDPSEKGKSEYHILWPSVTEYNIFKECLNSERQ